MLKQAASRPYDWQGSYPLFLTAKSQQQRPFHSPVAVADATAGNLLPGLHQLVSRRHDANSRTRNNGHVSHPYGSQQANLPSKGRRAGRAGGISKHTRLGFPHNALGPQEVCPPRTRSVVHKARRAATKAQYEQNIYGNEGVLVRGVTWARSHETSLDIPDNSGPRP